MKKSLITPFLIIITLIMSSAALAATPVRVFVGGQKLKTDVKPTITDGRIMLPLRAVFEAIDADVDYIAEERKVIATKKDKTVEFTIDSNVMKLNGEEKIIDVPAMIVDSRTLVPLRACAESFDLDVTWDPDTRIARIKKETSRKIEDNFNEKYTKYTYDENGNLTYCEDSDGDWQKLTYDKYGNLIYNEFSIGYWFQFTYDENDNLISTIDQDGSLETKTYDEDGNMIYCEDSDGEWYKNTYDEYGNLIYLEYSSEYYRKYSYNENNKIVFFEDSNGVSGKYEYNEDGKVSKYEDSDGYWYRCTYDEYGNLSYYESSEEYWYRHTYDENNNLIYYEDSYGDWIKYIVMTI